MSSLPPRLPNGIVAKHLSLFFSAVARNEATGGLVNGEISASAWQTAARQLALLAAPFRRLLKEEEEGDHGGGGGGNPLHAFAN